MQYKVQPGYDKTRNSTEKTFFHFKVGGFTQCTVKFVVTKQHLLEHYFKKCGTEGYRPVYRIGEGSYNLLPKEAKIYVQLC